MIIILTLFIEHLTEKNNKKKHITKCFTDLKENKHKQQENQQ